MCGDQRTTLGSVLTFHLIGGKTSLSVTTAYPRLANVSFRGLSGLSLQPHHGNTDITHTCPYMQLYVGWGDLNAELHTYVANALPTEPSPRALKWHFLHRKHNRILFPIYASVKDLKLR